MTRAAIPEIEILQRELKSSGGGLWLLANLVVLACTLALIAAMSWGVARYSRRAGAREPFPDTPADAGRGRDPAPTAASAPADPGAPARDRSSVPAPRCPRRAWPSPPA